MNLQKLINKAIKIAEFGNEPFSKTLNKRQCIKEIDIKKGYKYIVQPVQYNNIIDMYKNGKTLHEIGNFYGISRERVRQILKRYGLSRTDGGAFIKLFLNSENMLKKINDKEAAQEAKCQRVWGCTREQFKFFGAQAIQGTITNKFKTQRNNAKTRGIAWELTLKEWWDIWQESGHWNQRGLGKGKYHMTRICDTGSYSLENVEIKLHEENSKEARLMDKVYKRVVYTNKICYEINNNFYSLEQLSEIYGIKKNTIYARIKNGNSVIDACTKSVRDWGRC